MSVLNLVLRGGLGRYSERGEGGGGDIERGWLKLLGPDFVPSLALVTVDSSRTDPH